MGSRDAKRDASLSDSCTPDRCSSLQPHTFVCAFVCVRMYVCARVLAPSLMIRSIIVPGRVLFLPFMVLPDAVFIYTPYGITRGASAIRIAWQPPPPRYQKGSTDLTCLRRISR